MSLADVISFALPKTTKPGNSWVDLDRRLTQGEELELTVRTMRGRTTAQITRAQAAVRHLSVAEFMGTEQDKAVSLAVDILRGPGWGR